MDDINDSSSRWFLCYMHCAFSVNKKSKCLFIGWIWRFFKPLLYWCFPSSGDIYILGVGRKNMLRNAYSRQAVKWDISHLHDQEVFSLTNLKSVTLLPPLPDCKFWINLFVQLSKLSGTSLWYFIGLLWGGMSFIYDGDS